MSFITTVETTAAVVQAIVAIGENGYKIVEFVEEAVKEVESLADSEIVSSDSKFEVVIKYVKAFIDVLGENWSTLKEDVEKLIDAIVDAFNDLGIFTHASDSDSDD